MESRLFLEYKIFSPASVSARCVSSKERFNVSDNAASASEQYKGKYIEVTGKLSVIDIDSKYISLFPENNEFAIVGVQCFTKNNDQKEIVKTLSKDSSVTVKGKCTNVGEVMGYTLDIDEIVQ